MIDPDFPALRTFTAVVDAGGFGRAADRLGISQPAVSYRVAQLERQLGTALFESPRRRVILTAAGRALHDFCVRVIPELDALTSELADGSEPLAPLRVACPGAFGRNVVFRALESSALREVEVELLFRELDDIFDLVESGAVDLGMAYDIRVRTNLEFREIAREEFCLVTPADSALPPDVNLDQLVAEPFVTYEECDYVFGRWFADVFGRRPTRWRTALRFSRVEEVVEMVGAGRGNTIAPTHAIRGRPVEGRVRILRPSGRPRSYNPEYVVTRPGWRSRPDAELLLRAVEAYDPEAA